MIVQCCVCHRIRDDQDWVEPVMVLDHATTSHGYCPRCAAQAYEEVRRHLRELHGPVSVDAELPASLREAI